MSSITNSQRIVTQQDVAAALLKLKILSKRVAVDPSSELESYLIALDGVKACDLAAAVYAILQDALGHAFYPAPPELRRQCNIALDVRATQLSKAARRQREVQQRLPDVERTPEQRARIAALHRAFHDSLRPISEADEIEAIRQKYDPVALAAIPDREPATDEEDDDAGRWLDDGGRDHEREGKK